MIDARLLILESPPCSLDAGRGWKNAPCGKQSELPARMTTTPIRAVIQPRSDTVIREAIRSLPEEDWACDPAGGAVAGVISLKAPRSLRRLREAGVRIGRGTLHLPPRHRPDPRAARCSLLPAIDRGRSIGSGRCRREGWESFPGIPGDCRQDTAARFHSSTASHQRALPSPHTPRCGRRLSLRTTSWRKTGSRSCRRSSQTNRRNSSFP